MITTIAPTFVGVIRNAIDPGNAGHRTIEEKLESFTAWRDHWGQDDLGFFFVVEESLRQLIEKESAFGSLPKMAVELGLEECFLSSLNGMNGVTLKGVASNIITEAFTKLAEKVYYGNE